jgi:hypothetical protein
MRQALILLMCTAAMHAAVRDLDVGAEKDIEYRITQDTDTSQTTINLLNRHTRDVKLDVSVKPGMGDSGPGYATTVIIAAKSGVVLKPEQLQFTRPQIALSNMLFGRIMRKNSTAYTMDGTVAKDDVQLFYPDDAVDLSLYVGYDIYTAVDQLQLGYDRTWIASHIVSGTARDYGNGAPGSGNDCATYRYLEAPSKIIRNSQPVWTMLFELDGSNRIVALFKKYAIQ